MVSDSGISLAEKQAIHKTPLAHTPNKLSSCGIHYFIFNATIDLLRGHKSYLFTLLAAVRSAVYYTKKSTHTHHRSKRGNNEKKNVRILLCMHEALASTHDVCGMSIQNGCISGHSQRDDSPRNPATSIGTSTADELAISGKENNIHSNERSNNSREVK